MTDPWIPFMRAEFPGNLGEELGEVLSSGHVGAGESVDRFEQALAEFLGTDSVVSTSSCTAALTLAYIGAGTGPGTAVLSTPMTCAATNVALIQLGAQVHWLDVDPNSGNVTASAVSAGLRRVPEARVVVAMDWGGVPCDYTALSEVCRAHDAKLILDAAQSFGAEYDGCLLPAGPDFVCYSFGPTKLLSAVEGGAVTTQSPELRDRLRRLRWYGISRDGRDVVRFWDYDVTELGYRFTANNVFATVGLRMLRDIGSRLEHHRRLAEAYDEVLEGASGIRPCSRIGETRPNFWLYTVLAERRDDLMRKLHACGVHAATPHRRNDILLRPLFQPNSLDDLPGLATFAENYLCLPIGQWVSVDDVERIGSVINSGW
jgi:dTDP-4-amino-4,6-dideoxygalactose transaminase